MYPRIRAAFVGAGARGFGAHYPAIARLKDDVQIAAVCELDQARRERGAEFFDLPGERAYDDLDRMLEEVRPEVVYSVMGPGAIRPVAERCFAAGAHVVMEKPPGGSLADAEALVEAARRAGRRGFVTFQRRHAKVVVEAQRRILERGPLTLCLLEFHKNLLDQGPHATLWEDVCHVVDLARHLCGGRVASVHAERDKLFVDWTNSYNALVRFDNGSTAIITANRSSGGRFLRVAAHGHGILAVMDELPRSLRVMADGQDETIPGEPEAEAVVAMHRHFVECIRTGEPALTELPEALETMKLVEMIA